MTEGADIRQLSPEDVPALTQLLAANFTRHDQAFWAAAVTRLAAREQVSSTPWLGYGLFDDGLQGAVLTISSRQPGAGEPRILTNISSWCVNATHRGPVAKALYGQASTGSHASFSNLSAAAHTIKTITQFGYREWSAGQVIGIGTGRKKGRSPAILTPSAALREGLDAAVVERLEDHAALGCISFALALPEGPSPFIFLRRRIAVGLPCAQMIYCADMAAFSANSAVVSRHLLRHGQPVLLIDASGPVAGLSGRYFPGKSAKYYKGPPPQAAVDHCYSEMLYIGF